MTIPAVVSVGGVETVESENVVAGQHFFEVRHNRSLWQSRGFSVGRIGKSPAEAAKTGEKGKSGLPGTRKLSLWRNFGVISVDNPTGLFDRGLWEALGKFYLSTEFPAAFPHVHPLQKRGKSLILPCRRGILEKSTKDFRTPCVKLRFFHTLFNRLWKSVWKIHKEGMICGDFLWETKEFCTATKRRQTVFF